jgi:NAD(P)-dependent dehydrogenase (short-subunit alcohol dehydrogenase family)
MRDQRGGGHVFNVRGSGSDGAPTRGHALYGATKAAAALFSECAASELDSAHQRTGDGPNDRQRHAGRVRLHSLNPGLMDTALLRDHLAPAAAASPLAAGLLLRLSLDPAAVAEEAATQIERAVRAGGPGGRRLNCFARPLLRRSLAELSQLVRLGPGRD